MTTTSPSQPQPANEFRFARVWWVWWRSMARDVSLLLPIFAGLTAINLAVDLWFPLIGLFSFLLIYMISASTLTYMALTPYGETLDEAIGIGRRAWGTVALTSIGVCAILLILSRFFIIPAVLVLPFLALSVPVIMAERPGLRDLVKRCFELVQPVFVTVGLTLLSVLALHFAIVFVVLVAANLAGISLDRAWSVLEVCTVISLTYFAAALYIVRTVRPDLFYQALHPSNS